MNRPLSACVVQLRASNSGNTIGTGFFATESIVVSCAHVIDDVLNRPRGTAEQPTDLINLFGSENKEYAAEVIGWSPMRNEKSGLHGDIAVLKVTGGVSGVPSVLGDTAGIVGLDFESFGFPHDFPTQGRSASGRIGNLAFNHRFQLIHSAGPTFQHVAGGFSGGPVLTKGLIVGMVSAVYSQNDAFGALGYMIPIEEIIRVISVNANDVRTNLKCQSDPTFGNVQWMLDYLESGERGPRTEHDFELRVRIVDDLADVAAIHRDPGKHSYLADDLKPENFVVGEPLHPFIVSAPGGAGKSTFLARVIRAAKANGVVPFLLDMAKGREVPKTFPEFFKQFVCSARYADYESCFNQGRDIILLIDGLNERPSSLDGEEVDAINEFLRENTRVRVIITDRIKRRTIQHRLLNIATILPVSAEDIGRVVDMTHLSEAEIGLLSSPFFLDLFLTIRDSAAADAPTNKNTRVRMFRDFFERHVEKDFDERIDGFSKIAFRAFEMGRGPLLAAEEWDGLVKDAPAMQQVLLSLKSAGVLIERSDSQPVILHFRHQLFHDFLNAYALISLGKAHWRSSTFDMCTLRGASIEVIELAAEILEEESNVLLSEVYDWNYGAVLDCVKNLESKKHGGTSKVAKEFRDAIFILNAEKKFDRFAHTAERAAANYSELEKALPFLKGVASVSDLVDELEKSTEKKTGTPFWTEWVELYTKKSSLRDDQIGLLWSDPIIAWTAANVFRRFDLTAAQRLALREVFGSLMAIAKCDHRSVGTRWRIVHLLGVSTEEADQEFLLQVVLDASEDRWIRYGAVRSLMESLSRLDTYDKTERRQGIFKKIIKKLSEIKPGEVRVEMRRVAFLAKGVPERVKWAEDYSQVLAAGLEQANRISDFSDEKIDWTLALADALHLTKHESDQEATPTSEMK